MELCNQGNMYKQIVRQPGVHVCLKLLSETEQINQYEEPIEPLPAPLGVFTCTFSSSGSIYSCWLSLLLSPSLLKCLKVKLDYVDIIIYCVEKFAIINNNHQ